MHREPLHSSVLLESQLCRFATASSIDVSMLDPACFQHFAAMRFRMVLKFSSVGFYARPVKQLGFVYISVGPEIVGYRQAVNMFFFLLF